MSNNYSHVLDMLNEKKVLFLKLEEITSSTVVETSDKIIDSMKKRADLFDSMRELDKKISSEAVKDRRLRDALNNSCNKKDVDETLLEIFDLSLNIKAIANRLVKNEALLFEHLKAERNSILKEIEKLNKSGTAAANRYYNTTKLKAVKKIKPGKLI